MTIPEQSGVRLLSLKVNNLVWDPYQQKIYVSVPVVSSVNPNTISVLDPFTGALTGSRFVGSEPDRVALSDDGQFCTWGFEAPLRWSGSRSPASRRISASRWGATPRTVRTTRATSG